MKITLLIAIFSSWNEIHGQDVTELDKLTPLLRLFNEQLLETFQPPGTLARNLQEAKQLNRLQPRIHNDVPFPCTLKNGRSKIEPDSVHRLRPGDIDVVAALGDSLLAGNGLIASNILEVLLPNRGMSFATGGQGTWRQFVTIPNILKEYNENLIGYSKNTSFGHQKAAQLNLAEGGAMSRDLPYMSKVLINRMRSNPNINIQKDWKIISIMIGDNDFCTEVCYNRDLNELLKKHQKDLINALRILKSNLPRTFINLIPAPHLKGLVEATESNQPSDCSFLHSYLCPCLYGLRYRNIRESLLKFMSQWQAIEIEVANDPEFDTEDFTVVAQPFTIDYSLPKLKTGETDYGALSADCFHLSQKEDARAAVSLWNNMLEPIRKKTMHPTELFKIKCPSAKHPYLFTRRNS